MAADKKQAIKARHFLVSRENRPKIKPEVKQSTLATLGNTPETVRINNMIVRKKLLELTIDFLEPFHLFFERQYNAR